MARLELGRIAGIPIHLDTSWFLILTLLSWSLARGYFPAELPALSSTAYGLLGVTSAVLLFVCVVLHELSHALVARRYGIPVARIVLFIFGGVAHITGSPGRPLREFLMALAGPVASLALAAACGGGRSLLPSTTPLMQMSQAVLQYLAVVNVALAVFNLLPGYPLDGGRMLRAVLWGWSGNFHNATRIAGAVGNGLGLALQVLGVVALVQGRWIGGMWYILIGFFLRQAALASYHEGRE